METKEEMIEEIDVMEDLSTDLKEDKETKTEEVKPDIPVVEPVIEEVVSTDENKVEEVTANKSDEENISVEPKTTESDENKEIITEELPKKNKTPLIVLLSILLVLDIAALVIYMIGIEKVISFIK